MKMMKRVGCIALLLLAQSALALPPSVMSWQTIGQGTLRWYGFALYEATLSSPTGVYSPGAQAALEIQYKRSLSADILLKATDKAWSKAGIDPAQRRAWLQSLSALWPDIQKSDRLLFVYRASEGEFFHNDTSLGLVTDPALARAFIDIWLSPETMEPTLRKRLLGE